MLFFFFGRSEVQSLVFLLVDVQLSQQSVAATVVSPVGYPGGSATCALTGMERAVSSGICAVLAPGSHCRHRCRLTASSGIGEGSPILFYFFQNCSV